MNETQFAQLDLVGLHVHIKVEVVKEGNVRRTQETPFLQLIMKNTKQNIQLTEFWDKDNIQQISEQFDIAIQPILPIHGKKIVKDDEQADRIKAEGQIRKEEKTVKIANIIYIVIMVPLCIILLMLSIAPQ